MSTVGLNEATIAKHIRERGSADIALGRLGVKEHEGPVQEEVARPVRRARHASRGHRA